MWSCHTLFSHKNNIPIGPSSLSTLDVGKWTAIKLFWDWKFIIREDAICALASFQKRAVCFGIVGHQCFEQVMTRQIKPEKN